MIPFTDLSSQLAEISNDVETDVVDCLRNCSYIGGHYLERFERTLCNYLGINHVIGVSSGTDALMLACEVFHIGNGDYVLVQNNAFIATAFSIVRAGACPIFVDCDPDTFIIDMEHVEKLVGGHQKRKRIKAIVVSDMYGQQADMEKIQEFCRAHKLYFLEDASHSLGSTHRGQHVGHYSDLAYTSFSPGKPLSGIGQGGAIITNDTIVAKKLRIIINQGCEKPFQHITVGGNFKLDSIVAAQLYHGIKRLENWNERRRNVAKIYNENFTADQRPTQQPCGKHIYHLYEFKCANGAERDRVERELINNQIGYGFHYPHLISDMPMFAELGILETPIAYDMRDRIISLPIHPNLTEDQALEVVLVVQSVVS